MRTNNKIALTVYILLAIIIIVIFIASWIMYAEYVKLETKITLLRATSGYNWNIIFFGYINSFFWL